MHQILAATGNAHKLAEIRQILAPLEIQVLGARDVGGLPEVEEDADTFRGNAVKKAVTVARLTRRITLADDSGLEVLALDGAPGVRSARYAGEPTNDVANTAKLLERLAGVPDRRARFVCVIALAAPDGTVETVEGDVPGYILQEPRGRGGFGYDPVFVPDGCTETFAEMDADAKNTISHRANALRRAVDTGMLVRFLADAAVGRHGAEAGNGA